MLHIVLYEPEIPPNTGNIMRLCANTGCALHLIEPLGFTLDDRKLRRAGLDYREFAPVQTHASLKAFTDSTAAQRIFALTTRGQRRYTDLSYRRWDTLLFGPETRGLPDAVLEELGDRHCLRIPMRPGSRSLNLSNAAALVAYEALRQLDFPGLLP
ncbi:MAG: tRNA (uridine(34)/cytosine(34)/5-carboxymethylaminomethyluridine(34)-2'-O)-methyltransferase TrmL [Chromatocurvus sp.]